MNSNIDATRTGLALDRVSITYWLNRGFKRVPVHAVQDCTLHIGEGETLALIGESGSGKTTITNAVLGLVPISSGRISFGGNTLSCEHSRRSHAGGVDGVQVVMQDPLSSFNPRYRIRSSLAMPLRMKGACAAEIKDRLDFLVKRVGINPELLEKYPHQLSGGQLQRLSIARAVSVNPSLVIADEPASKLDVSVRAQVLNLLKDILTESGSSLLLITHDLEVAKFLCEKVAIMRHGKMIESGYLRTVFANPADSYTRTLLESSGLL